MIHLSAIRKDRGLGAVEGRGEKRINCVSFLKRQTETKAKFSFFPRL